MEIFNRGIHLRFPVPMVHDLVSRFEVGLLSVAKLKMPDDKKSEDKPEEKKLKPCCACPETRKPRDAW